MPKRKKKKQQEDFYEEDYYEEDNFVDDNYDDEPYYDETGITKASLSKARRYFIISILFFLLSIGGFFGIQLFDNIRTANAQRTCWLNEQQVEEQALDYVRKNSFMSYPAYIEDVSGFVEPKCSSGGTYTWEPVSGQYVCSEHGHYPKGFNAPEAEQLGTETIVTEEE